MKKGLWIALVISSLGALSLHSRPSQAHDDEFRVSVEIDEQQVLTAGAVELSFQLIDLKNKVLVTDQDVLVMHENKLHFFWFDPALKEFRHEHPVFEKDHWKVTTNLSVNGNYFIWAQGQLAIDGEEFASFNRIQVTGGTTENPTPPQLGEIRSGTDGSSKIILSNQTLKANQMVMLDLAFARTDGSTPDLTPYLGELAHIVAVSEDGDSLVHVHPMGNPGSLHAMVHVTFPDAGEYRLWVQFVDGGSLRMIPLSVVVGN